MSFEYAPKIIKGNAWFMENHIKTLTDIHKHIHQIDDILGLTIKNQPYHFCMKY